MKAIILLVGDNESEQFLESLLERFEFAHMSSKIEVLSASGFAEYAANLFENTLPVTDVPSSSEIGQQAPIALTATEEQSIIMKEIALTATAEQPLIRGRFSPDEKLQAQRAKLARQRVQLERQRAMLVEQKQTIAEFSQGKKQQEQPSGVTNEGFRNS